MHYGTFVSGLIKDGAQIAADLRPHEANMWHLATGVSGEAGELLDAIKKFVIYRKPLDRNNVIEELGDLEFYMEGLRQAINVSREEVVQANIAKLKHRYGDKYTDEKAIERADKQ